MATRPTTSRLNTFGLVQSQKADLPEILSAEAFHRVIILERKRSERSKRSFALLLVDAGVDGTADEGSRVLRILATTLQETTRETDITGWYEEDGVVGVMFTEILPDQRQVVDTILSRLTMVLRERLDDDEFGHIKFSLHVFPDDWDKHDQERPSNRMFYPDLEKRERANRVERMIKRLIDVTGSFSLLLLFSPVFLTLAAAIKLTSRGPVFFRQKRIGQHGKPFTFFKFRSMYANNDASEHKEYVLQLIKGNAAKKHANGNGDGVFKLTEDKRITPVGKFLRRSSLDELPQLLNVLIGEMSLVGPRPPIPYEVEAYETWHRRRLLEAKPGITGLWQVHGRSRVEFDDMVRLDLRYARECSPWLDLKILLQTPAAVIAGDGAC